MLQHKTLETLKYYLTLTRHLWNQMAEQAGRLSRALVWPHRTPPLTPPAGGVCPRLRPSFSLSSGTYCLGVSGVFTRRMFVYSNS